MKISPEKISLLDYATEDAQIGCICNVFYSNKGVAPDGVVKEAKTLLNSLVKKNSAAAINLKGVLYYEGRGYKQDQKKAVALYEKAAELGNSLSMCNLGYAYLHGNGTEINYEKAYMYFTMAEHRGECDAINKIGDMYKNGIYVPKDEAMAFNMYMRCYQAVPHDDTNDAYPGVLKRLGGCFLKGIGTEVNLMLAEQLLMEAKAIYDAQIEEGNYYATLSIVEAENYLRELEMTPQEDLSDE